MTCKPECLCAAGAVQTSPPLGSPTWILVAPVRVGDAATPPGHGPEIGCNESTKQTNGWEGWECNGLQPQNDGLQPTRDGPPIGGCGCVFLEVWLGRPVYFRPSGRSSSADLSSKTGVARAFHSRREGGFPNPQPSHHRPFPAFQGVPRSGWRDLDRLVNESTSQRVS